MSPRCMIRLTTRSSILNSQKAMSLSYLTSCGSCKKRTHSVALPREVWPLNRWSSEQLKWPSGNGLGSNCGCIQFNREQHVYPSFGACQILFRFIVYCDRSCRNQILQGPFSILGDRRPPPRRSISYTTPDEFLTRNKTFFTTNIERPHNHRQCPCRSPHLVSRTLSGQSLTGLPTCTVPTSWHT
ncbi:hypothetical protein VTN31DRAFT_4867 [Thermomyces dupontii]|uniref:uncharacterized protein n=1 Tax=Talaromyces thermophilus TaxID=28565 RepID=UPI00374374F7